MKELNLNHNLIFVEELKNGTTEMKVKISRSYYFLKFEKNALNTFLSVQKKTKSKFPEDLGAAFIKNSAIIDSDFVLNIDEIDKATSIFDKYKHYLSI